MGAKISKRYSPTNRSQMFSNLNILNYPPNGPHKTTLGTFEILLLIFNDFFFRNFQTHHCNLMEKSRKILKEEKSFLFPLPTSSI